MAYVYAFSTADPVGTDLVKDGAAEIRTGVKAALSERILSVIASIDNDPWQFKNIQAAVTNTYDIGTVTSWFKAGYVNALAVNIGVTPDAGSVLLANSTGAIKARNNVGSANLTMMHMSTGDVLQLYNGAATVSAAGVVGATTFIGALTGNATTATTATTAITLQTARTIWGQSFDGSASISGAMTYGGVTLSNAVTGTGSMVLSAGPTFTGTTTLASATLTGTLTVTGATITGLTAASVGAGTFPAGAYVFSGAVSGITTLGTTGNATLVNPGTNFNAVLSVGNVTAVANNSSAIRLLGANAGSSWQIDSNRIVGDTLCFTPSTALGGSTFTTPVLQIASSGAISATGSFTIPTIVASGTTGTVTITSTVGTNAALLKMINTGGNYYIGAQNSTGGIFAAGAYDFVIEMPSLGNALQINHTTGVATFLLGLSVLAGGFTVTSGTTAVQALTATTGNFSGNVTALAYFTSSLRKLKQNIKPFAGSALEIVRGTDIYGYAYNSDPSLPRVGWMADTTHEILAGRKHDRMDIPNAVGILMKAVQELAAENEALRMRLN